MKTTLLAACIAIFTSNAVFSAQLGFAKRPPKKDPLETPKTAALKHDTSASAPTKKPLTTPRWSYTGNTGPRNWANLHRDFSDCSGRNQSPINLSSFTESVLKPISFNYQPEAAALLNDGRTVQLNYRQPKFIEAEGSTFNLQQFHFHSPSENQIKGESFPLEAHFVHRNDDGHLAVVAVMFREGAENPALPKSIEQLPAEAGRTITLEAPISPDELLPDNREYYRFNGSLTTPPCTEGVRWFLLKTPATASSQQLDAMRSAIGQPNNRPVQALNARVVLK